MSSRVSVWSATEYHTSQRPLEPIKIEGNGIDSNRDCNENEQKKK